MLCTISWRWKVAMGVLKGHRRSEAFTDAGGFEDSALLLLHPNPHNEEEAVPDGDVLPETLFVLQTS